MKYLFLLLMLRWMSVEGQYAKGNLIIIDTNNNRLSDNLYFVDTCQKYRDSVTKYNYNIGVWKKRKSPMNDPGYNILIDEKIRNLEAIKKKYRKLLDKCK